MVAQSIANIISTVLALIAIGGLVHQSRSTRKQLKLQNFMEYTKRYQEIVLRFPENINRADFDIESLGPSERDRTMRYMRAYLDLCFEEYTLHKQRFIDDDLWEIWKGGMETAFGKAAFQQAWNRIQKDTEYGEKFHQFAKELGIESNVR